MVSYNNDGRHVTLKIHSWPYIPFLFGWLLMLFMGGFHNEINPDVPAISYWLSVGIVAVWELMWIIGWKIGMYFKRK